MLDRYARKLIDPPLNQMARGLVRTNVTANQITVFGLGTGFATFLCVAFGAFEIALILLLLNRLGDGLDGAVARLRGPTEFGGYIDIVADFALWALLPLGFALYDPAYGFAAAVLLASFIGTGTTFLAHAILAAKAGDENSAQGRKSFFYLGGLTEGTETIAFFIVMLLWPQHFAPFAYIFAALAALTVVTRTYETWGQYGPR
jgi:phosphatidylglycerophosphate synthase